MFCIILIFIELESEEQKWQDLRSLSRRGAGSHDLQTACSLQDPFMWPADVLTRLYPAIRL